MAKNKRLILLPLTTIGMLVTSCLGLATYAAPADVGSKGANVYCFMRNSGNSHSVSWEAAYQIIKRQKSSLFKTSPKHAAVMITETVVQNPDIYKNCGAYLGDLYGSTNLNSIPEETPPETKETPSEIKKGDRYSY
ncbi:DUF6554 family protein [Prochlorococcus sp. MIT 1307]|uniref:DUF6554 family protein n=1 Tax=Prochlorococcus sp. MIT 1307 TaxID=3096219 RepID=UPI002A74D824|nr:DUF6554 family protein [Prochlorococcus sp. MIT 1307]